MVLAEDLRQAVLQAALQGKLTEQLDTDSNVDEMLENIQKENVIVDKKIKKEKQLSEIQDEDIEFEVPDNWIWEKVGRIIEIKNGFTPKRTDETLWNPKEIPWFTVEDIHNQGLNIYHTAQAISRKAIGKTSGRIIPPHTVLLCCTSATIGRYAMTEIELTTNQQWNGLVIKEEYKHIICSEYVLVWVSSLKEKMTEIAKSTTFPFLSVDKLANFIIPLPPIEEQRRIADKINEIMPKIDEYEKIETELEVLKKKFPIDMKDALLQAAMQGKLTEQLESDSSVDDLLLSIQKEKEELVAQKKIKKEKPLPDIEEEELPFDIPDNWRWVRLKNIVYSGGQKTPDKCFSYIDIGSIDNIHQKLNDEDNIIEADKAPSRAKKIVNYGDVLYATVRPYLHNMCIIDRYFKKEPIASTGFAVMTCCKGILNRFLLLYMLSPEFDRYANSIENAKGMAYPAINDDKFYRALIPIPPKEEQQRIVEKLDTLLPLCEDLKEN